ncbi:hypothetical protein BB8028_0006g05110 [Beauveria bassiana]|uniref:Uncharacterized protein n=1 Tax=Beauveria bassiana TaxID=176275 RepID=A0A2S7YJ39_BEABA|nr:hypothetical protein BB8028_0006g05110 [Beauveria bassiana]
MTVRLQGVIIIRHLLPTARAVSRVKTQRIRDIQMIVLIPLGACPPFLSEMQSPGGTPTSCREPCAEYIRTFYNQELESIELVPVSFRPITVTCGPSATSVIDS